MKELLDKLHEVGEKAGYLQQRTQTLVEDNKALRLKIQELESDSARKDSRINDLSTQLEIVKLAKGLGTGEQASSEELKNKINEYIREIDQCLKLIGG